MKHVIKTLGILIPLSLSIWALSPSAASAERDTTAMFTVQIYPAKVHAVEAKGATTLVTEAGSIECQRTLHTDLTTGEFELRLTPTYGECTAFGMATATVKPEECKYTYDITTKEFPEGDDYQAVMGVFCPPGQSIKVTTLTCKFEITSQQNLRVVDFDNLTSQGDIAMTDTVKEVFYDVTSDGFGCPFAGTGSRSNGQFISHSPTTLIAKTWSGGPEEIHIG